MTEKDELLELYNVEDYSEIKRVVSSSDIREKESLLSILSENNFNQISLVWALKRSGIKYAPQDFLDDCSEFLSRKTRVFTSVLRGVYLANSRAKVFENFCTFT